MSRICIVSVVCSSKKPNSKINVQWILEELDCLEEMFRTAHAETVTSNIIKNIEKFMLTVAHAFTLLYLTHTYTHTPKLVLITITTNILFIHFNIEDRISLLSSFFMHLPASMF